MPRRKLIELVLPLAVQHRVRYLRQLFLRESDVDITSVDYNFAKPLTVQENPDE